MSEVKIAERITIDEPHNVEIAIMNLTGRAIDFELIHKFIVNEKNTMFYLNRKLNSSTEYGTYNDFLWLDTGIRDNRNNPIMIGLLFEQMEKMQEYIDELLLHIEKNEKDSQEEIIRLKEQNKEYKRALVDIRTFMQDENDRQDDVAADMGGHSLLGRNEKILVLGNADIRVAEMRAIAREYFGFEKTDFEFITDYEKVKNAGSRIHASERFAAVWTAIAIPVAALQIQEVLQAAALVRTNIIMIHTMMVMMMSTWMETMMMTDTTAMMIMRPV